MSISMQQRLAGLIGGAALVLGTFYPAFVFLQAISLLPMLFLLRKEGRISTGAVVGFYMGLTYVIPQVIYFKMPVIVTVILLVYMTVLLTLLGLLLGYLYKRYSLITCFAVGGVWVILDYLNYTALPIWGVAQSFARPWSYYPQAIGFISWTGISGVLFIIGLFQACAVDYIFRNNRKQIPVIIVILLVLFCVGLNVSIREYAIKTIKVATAGWVLDERDDSSNPNLDIGFEKLVEKTASEAAEEGARIFTTGEMGFYYANHNRKLWEERFARIATEYDMWLVIGYYDLTYERNMIFFMNPEGKVVETYNKTFLTPFEPGLKGDGSLKIVEIDGLKIGAMICHDDNYYEMTRYYGNLKADVILCPTADWDTVKDVHLQAVRARAIECNYGIVRAAANGISAAIAPSGKIIKQMDHFKEGNGYLVAEVPVHKDITFFSKYGQYPILVLSAIVSFLALISKNNKSEVIETVQQQV